MQRDRKVLGDDWPASAMEMMGTPPTAGPENIPQAPFDGRDLPDVDLDALAESILANLSRDELP